MVRIGPPGIFAKRDGKDFGCSRSECGLRGLLLGQAVEGAEAPDEVDGVDADDFAGGEAAGDGVEGVAVVGVVEGGDEDEVVGDVEVGVAGGEALAFED